MAVNIESLSTEVTPEPEPPAGGAAAPPGRWEQIDQMREALARSKRDRSRTAAEDFHD